MGGKKERVKAGKRGSYVMVGKGGGLWWVNGKGYWWEKGEG